MEPWLGVIHLVQPGETGSPELEGLAAVFCADHQGFDGAVRAFAERQGYQLLWSEEVHQAGYWIARHSKEKHAAGLARAVHESHPVEFGLLRAIGQDGSAPEPKSYLVIKEIEGVGPLGMQIGVERRKSVPDVLLEPLFGQPAPREAEIAHYGSAEAVPPMRTYAILDAAKIMFGLSVIEDCEMPFRCLFKGEAAEELQDVAPYIIELSPDTGFTRTLFTHDPAFPENHSTVHLWHKEPGIYIRSRATLDNLWKHFRKFTRLYSKETDSWCYFRFYAPETLRTIIAAFDETQFEKFGKDIAMIACQSKSGFCTITRRPKATAAQPLKVA